MTIPFGWWLIRNLYQIIETDGARTDTSVREAILYSERTKLERSEDQRLNHRPRYELMGFTSDPAVVMAWVNEGSLPKEATPVKDPSDPVRASDPKDLPRAQNPSDSPA